MPYKRKKENTLKKLLIDELFFFIIFLAVLIFLVGAPNRVAVGFFMILDKIHLGRIGTALVWIVIYLFVFFFIFFSTLKETRWNNKNINLDVIKIDLSCLRVFNYRKEVAINLNDIKKISIMNKDSIIKIGYKDKYSIIPKNLEDNRKTFDSLKEILSPINTDIVFFDSSSN